MIPQLATLPLLDALTPAQRAVLSAVGVPQQYPPGTRLFDEGQPADRCWIILSGCVAVDIAVPGQGSVTVQGVGQGDLLGLSWFVPPYRWHFGATVVSPTRALVLDAARLRALADEDPALGYRLSLVLAQSMLTRLQSTRLRLLDLYRNAP
ncbi:Crp/Fnr family transcriptional regulator [Actinosynnema sp. NPDC059335]|uniref:Crp/Fnr family transcriptional regulator n=1 Tax=Actinosynnema sp. NPDC059335 TaxID=3346804 RepID=UPI00366B7684